MKSFRSFCVAIALAACAVFPASGFAGDADVQVAFSPDGGGEALVLSTIQSARISIRLLAYSFTAAPVVRALIAAKRRGVDVAVTVDYRNNIEEDRSGKARAALGALVNAGITVTVVSAYPLQHSKFDAIDSAVIQTGSYNYSQQAALYNSEKRHCASRSARYCASLSFELERRYRARSAIRPEVNFLASRACSLHGAAPQNLEH